MKKTLEGLIKFKQNDLMMMIDDGMATNDTEKIFNDLIIEVTRLVNDIRYCTNKHCMCSPEFGIANHYKKFIDILQKNKIRVEYALEPFSLKKLERISQDYGRG